MIKQNWNPQRSLSQTRWHIEVFGDLGLDCATNTFRFLEKLTARPQNVLESLILDGKSSTKVWQGGISAQIYQQKLSR
jgi:hypothetical protein